MSQSGTLLRGTASHTAGAAKFGTNGLAGGVYQHPSFTDSFVSVTGRDGGDLGVPSAKFGTGGLSSGVYNWIAAVDSHFSATGADGGVLSGVGSVEAFVKTTATDRRVICGHQGWYWLGIDSGGYPMARFGAAGAETTLTGTTPINDGQMHHIALSRDASLRLHVDGVQVASNGTARTAGTSIGSFTVGGFGNVTATDWAAAGGGTIDEVRVSNIARYTGGTYTVPTAELATDANTTLLLHFNGNQADASANNRTATLVRTGTAVAGNGIATIEGWVKTTGASARVAIGHDSAFWVGMRFDGLPRARYGSNGDEVTLDGTVAINDGGWHHLALVLGDGTTNRFYVDGNLVASSSIPKVFAATGSTARLCIGGFSSSGAADWAGDGSGVVDEVRISKVARYTGSTYTVPTAAFTADANTSLLAHLEADATDSSGQTLGARIEPTDANLLFSPYTWKRVAGSAKTINPGAYFRALIAGSPSSITLEFDLTGITAPLPILAYSIDGKGFVRVPLSASVQIPLPTDNTWPVHSLTVVVDASTQDVAIMRWTPQSTAVVLTGISCGGANVTTKPPTRRKLNAIIYGDSITEGVRTLSAAAVDVDGNSAAAGWAYRLGDTLGAEVGVVGFGRQGAERAAVNSGNVPAGKTTWQYLWSGEPRDFTTPAPDLVFFAWSENDGGNSITTAAYKAAMLIAVNGVLAATPVTTKIALMTNFRAAFYPGVLAQVAAECSKPSRVRVVDTTGWIASSDSSDTVHPYGWVGSARVAGLLAVEGRKIIERGTFVRIAGNAVPVAIERV